MKGVIYLLAILCTCSVFANIQKEISDMCLRSAEHISFAEPGSHRDEVIEPTKFNNYEELNRVSKAVYADYYLSNNPSTASAHFHLLKNLRAIRFLISNKQRDTIQSFNEALEVIQEIRSYLYEADFSVTLLGQRQGSIYGSYGNIAINLACYSGSLSPGDCSQAIKYLLSSSSRRFTNIGDTLYPGIIEKYLSQNVYNNVLKIVALQMLKLLENYLMNNKLPHGDVFQIISEELRSKLKFSNEVASSWTLSILELFAARGADWFHRGTDWKGEKNSSITSILILTSAIQFFDKITFKLTGKQFSIPKQINTSCYYGKPYHFWMSAYMAHDAITNGNFDKKSAVMATHMLGVGYELGRIRSYLVEPTYDSLPLSKSDQFSPAANAARIDLVFNTLGAWFGAVHNERDTKPKSVNATRALEKILKESSIRLSYQGWVDNAIKFYDYYAPHAHLNYVLSRL